MVQRRLGLQPHTQQLAATLLAARGRIAAATYRVMLTIPDTACWLLLVLYNGLRDASLFTKLTLRSLGRGILAPPTHLKRFLELIRVTKQHLDQVSDWFMSVSVSPTLEQH